MENLKDLYNKGDKSVYKFDSIFEFIQFCDRHKLNYSNSDTYVDEDSQIMYLKKLK